MTLTSTFWYEIIYPDQTRVFFQFLDTTADGRLRCRLCNGQETLEIFRGTYMEIIEYGENSPCD
jgi:hypothetical protein